MARVLAYDLTVVKGVRCSKREIGGEVVSKRIIIKLVTLRLNPVIDSVVL